MTDPNDKPGKHHVVVLRADAAEMEAAFDSQSAQGYELVAINDKVAVFYREEKKEQKPEHGHLN